MNNLYEDVPRALPAERIDALLDTPAVRLERIVPTGHATPAAEWYNQERDEWVVVLRGRARLRFETEAEPRELGAGDYVMIPAHARHRVEWTDPAQPTVWLALFCGSTSCRSNRRPARSSTPPSPNRRSGGSPR